MIEGRIEVIVLSIAIALIGVLALVVVGLNSNYSVPVSYLNAVNTGGNTNPYNGPTISYTFSISKISNPVQNAVVLTLDNVSVKYSQLPLKILYYYNSVHSYAFTQNIINATGTVYTFVNISACGATTISSTFKVTESCSVTAGYAPVAQKPAGAYAFSTLIGSVLNDAILYGALQSTKYLIGTSGTQYAFYGGSQTPSIITSPPASPYSTYGIPPGTQVTPSTGGGLAFGSFRQNGWDNIMQITNAQLLTLYQNYGPNLATEYLWLTGYTVYNQQQSAQEFQDQGAGGAYQVVFNKPIWWTTPYGTTMIDAQIALFGQPWTIINETPPRVSTVGSENVVNGGRVMVGYPLTQLTTVYVGQNLTAGPYRVEVTDLGQPNANGISAAGVGIYYNNVLTNVTYINPQATATFNISGHLLYIGVNETFDGLYAYEKYAQIQLFSSVYNITNGGSLGLNTAPTWYARLLWTNTSSTSPGFDGALQSIVLINATTQTLLPGQGFNFVNNPSTWKVTFVGGNISTSNLDQVSAHSSYNAALKYANIGTVSSGSGLGITNITEPAQLLTVTSSIVDAFSYAGQQSSTVSYDLTPYELNDYANTLGLTGPNAVAEIGIFLSYSGDNGGAWVSNTNPLPVSVYGCQTKASTSCSATAFNYNGITEFTSSYEGIYVSSNTATLFNVTGITLGRALPGPLEISVVAINSAGKNVSTLATLTSTSPVVYYTQPGLVYDQVSQYSAANTVYNQQNGGAPSLFSLVGSTPTTPAGELGQYYTYSMSEFPVPSNTTAQDMLQFGIDNSSFGISAEPFQINYSVATASNPYGIPRNVTYVSTQGHSVPARTGFITERGSTVTQISASVDNFDLAEFAQKLGFTVN